MKTYGKAKITRHKAGSSNKSVNNDVSFVKKNPKTPKGSASVDEAVAKFVNKKSGGTTRKIKIKTTSVKVKVKRKHKKIKEMDSELVTQQEYGEDPIIVEDTPDSPQ